MAAMPDRDTARREELVHESWVRSAALIRGFADSVRPLAKTTVRPLHASSNLLPGR